MSLPEIYIKRLSAGRWACLSAYHPAVVAAVKSFPGSRWDGQCWTFGPDIAAEILQQAEDDCYPWRHVSYTGESAGPPVPELCRALNLKDARDYQELGVGRASHDIKERGGFLLADDRGLGKTFQALKVAHLFGAQKVLVICPAIAKSVWLDQVDKWLGKANSLVVLRGLQPIDMQLAHWQRTPQITIVNYDILAGRKTSRKQKAGGFNTSEYSGWADALVAWKPDLLILDEAHAVKNKSAARTAAVAKIAAASKARLALTGTPVWNKLLDVFGLMDVLFPGAFGTKFQFAQAYMEPIHNGYGWEYTGVNKLRLDELQRRLTFYMLSRKKVDVLKELPAKTRVIVPIDGFDTEISNQDDYDLQQGVRGGGLKWLKSAQGLSAQTTVLHELSRIKAPYTAEQVLSVLSDTTHVVVFAHFKEATKLIAAALNSRVATSVITGDTSDKERVQAQQAWEAAERGVLIMTTAAGGVALNLQRANVVVFNDLEWAPSALLQAEDRIHRLGQSLPCTIYYMVARGTVEDAVADSVIAKMDAAERVTGGSDTLMALSEEQSLADIVAAITGGYNGGDEWLSDEDEELEE